MALWTHRRLVPVVTILFILALFAPLATFTSAQDPAATDDPSLATAETPPAETDPADVPLETADSEGDTVPIATETAPVPDVLPGSEPTAEPAMPPVEPPDPTEEPVTGGPPEVPISEVTEALPTESTNETDEVTVESSLTVTVMDGDSSAPLTGAAAVVYDTDGAAVASGSSDSTGTIFFTVPEGYYHLAVTAEGYQDAWVYWQWVGGPTELPLALQVLPQAGTLTVHVIDQLTGAPVIGATVAITWPISLSGTTDATGTFVTPEMASGQYYLEVYATGYPTGYGSVVVDGAMEITVPLDPILPGTLTVYAVNQESGAPIAGATVVVRDYWAGGLEVASGTTGADGGFLTGELPAGDYTIDVAAENYVAGWALRSIDGPTEAQVALEPLFPGTVTVSVLDQATGAPIAGAAVVATNWEELEIARGTTDAGGVFVTPELAGGNNWITASAQGYASTWAYYLRLNGPTAITIQLAPLAAGDLTVTVTEQWSWAPIEGASVVVRDAVTGIDVASGVTDTAGIFVASELAGGSYTLAVTAAGYFPASSAVSVNGHTSTFLQMQPQIDGILSVTASSGLTGDPVSGASVTITDAEGIDVALGMTADDGVFSTSSLQGGAYTVAVAAAGYQPSEGHAFVSGTSALQLVLQPTSGTLTIRVVDQITGAPVAGAAVRVNDPWTTRAEGTTDLSGEFVTGVLEPARYFVEVGTEWYFTAYGEAFVQGDTVLTVALEPRLNGVLTVQVTDGVSGEPIHKASVVVEGMSTRSGTTNSKGTFETDTLIGDWYSVEVQAEGYDPDSGVRHILVSGPTELVVRLDPQAPGRLLATVVDAVTGEPVANAVIEIRDQSTWSLVSSGKSRKDGSFTTKELAAGSYSIEVTGDGYFPRGDGLWVSGDTAVTLWMLPRVDGSLNVTVLDQGSGSPVPKANVWVTNPLNGEVVASGNTDGNGVFRTDPLEAGDYSLAVTADGYLPNRNGYAFVNGDAEITLSLEPAVAGTLTVSVMDQSTWQPLPGATAIVRTDAGVVVATGATADNGLFVVELAGGDYIVEAAADGYVLTGFASIHISGPASVSLAMMAGEPGSLTVIVLDEQSGTRIANASVTVRDEAGREVAIGATDGEGTFTTGELATGGYRINVVADRYHPYLDAYGTVNGANTVVLAVVLRTEATLALSASDATPGTRVQVRGQGYQPGERVTIMWHDPEGMVLATTRAKHDGSIAVSIVIPETYPSWHRVVSIGSDSDIVEVAYITVPWIP